MLIVYRRDLVDGLGALVGKTGALVLLTGIIAMLTLWTAGFAVRQRRAAAQGTQDGSSTGGLNRAGKTGTSR